MEVSRNNKKAAKDVRDHSLSFDEAETVWNDPGLVIAFDGEYDGQLRWLASGQTDLGLLLVEVHVELNDTTP